MTYWIITSVWFQRTEINCGRGALRASKQFLWYGAQWSDLMQANPTLIPIDHISRHSLPDENFRTFPILKFSVELCSLFHTTDTSPHSKLLVTLAPNERFPPQPKFQRSFSLNRGGFPPGREHTNPWLDGCKWGRAEPDLSSDRGCKAPEGTKYESRRFVLFLLCLTSTVKLLNGRYLQIPSGLSFTNPKLHQMIQRLKFAEQVRSKEDINKNDMLQKYLCIFSQSLSLLYPIYIANVWGVVVFYAALRSAEVGVEWGNRRYRHLIRNTSK